ncbi:hypothetical protein TNCV_3909841 [Trichonephila clavipes]|nr:hypothetical protein TNCV_3909841 [Trichonephila clavipes]
MFPEEVADLGGERTTLLVAYLYEESGCDYEELGDEKVWAAFRSRRESTTGESPPFPEENTSMPYSGFEPEPNRLQAEVISTTLARQLINLVQGDYN